MSPWEMPKEAKTIRRKPVMSKQNKKGKVSKLIIRVLCFVLALSMVATTLFMLIQYLMYL